MHCSKFTGDLPIGVYNNDSRKGKIVRFNRYRELIQTIAHDEGNYFFYSDPTYIENSNRDLVVCDMGRKCIVVTEKQGSHRFSYRGKNLEPRAICTDTLSHILVCDHFIYAVQMLNKDGQFLKYLRQKQTHDVDCFFYKKPRKHRKTNELHRNRLDDIPGSFNPEPSTYNTPEYSALEIYITNKL